MRKTFRYRLYPTKVQAQALEQQLREGCKLYNAALITFPSYGDGVRLLPLGKLRVQGVGVLKVKLHRPVDGKIKTVTLKREAGKWYVCFSVEVEAQPLADSLLAVGLDVGLESFAVLSDGTSIANPRQYRKAQARLRRAQRKVAQRQKGSHHLVQTYGLIAVEDLNIKGLAAGMLAKSVNDASWSGFFSKLTYKAESAGRLLVTVDPRGTSQRCSACGVEVRKQLKDRWHTCASCGLSVSRDRNSAVEILRLGLSLTDVTLGFCPCVSVEAVCFC